MEEHKAENFHLAATGGKHKYHWQQDFDVLKVGMKICRNSATMLRKGDIDSVT